MSRHRGAQPGNTNAIKHGFYSRQFRAMELDDLEVVEASLQDEIAGMRVAGRRMLELVDQVGDPSEAIRCYSAFSAHNLRIARLLQIHNTLTGGGSDNLAVIQEAISATLARKMKEQ